MEGLAEIIERVQSHTDSLLKKAGAASAQFKRPAHKQSHSNNKTLSNNLHFSDSQFQSNHTPLSISTSFNKRVIKKSVLGDQEQCSFKPSKTTYQKLQQPIPNYYEKQNAMLRHIIQQFKQLVGQLQSSMKKFQNVITQQKLKVDTLQQQLLEEQKRSKILTSNIYKLKESIKHYSIKISEISTNSLINSQEQRLLHQLKWYQTHLVLDQDSDDKPEPQKAILQGELHFQSLQQTLQGLLGKGCPLEKPILDLYEDIILKGV